MSIMPHWSATRFMLFEQCPASFKERYVDGVAIEPTEALSFGQAVHMGLEAHYNGEAGERAFRAAWKQMTLELDGRVSRGLTATGLCLLQQVFDLNLAGTPERGFSIDTNYELGAPIVGAMDLWDQRESEAYPEGVIFDFKTTRGLWSQERAQAETWQPVLYPWAAWEETDRWPAFEYIVLNRFTGSLERFRRKWSADQYLAWQYDAWRRMETIAARVAAGDFVCSGQHGACPECGERWSHEHVCDDTHQRRIRL